MENRNLLIAIISALIIFVGWHYFYEAPKQARETQAFKTSSPSAVQGGAETSQNPSHPLQQQVLEQHLADPGSGKQQEPSRRLDVESPSLEGSINLRGARFDDLRLRHYKEKAEPTSDPVVLFSPAGSEHPYFAEFGWVSQEKNVRLPQATTEWVSDHHRLTPLQPVTLTWNNGQGLVFQRIIAMDAQYLFTLTDSVYNEGTSPITLNPYALISRTGTPKTSGFMILHEGPLGFLQDSLKEYTYKDLQEDSLKAHEGTGGWLGITDKYWLSALIPDQGASFKTHFRKLGDVARDRYQVDYLGKARTVLPGESVSFKTHLFAGAKVLEVLDRYEETLKVQHLDKAVDFGWFYFITKPFFYALTYLHTVLGNFGLAILLLTVALKVLFFPLANKSYRSMARMKKLQPEMERLRATYGQDKMRLNQAVMDLYKRQKVNPLSGCLPMFIQIPVFFALYKVLFVSIEMRHAPFYGWIHDLSAPDPTTLFNLFGLIPWTPPSFLMLGIWPLFMGVTMFAQQKLNPTSADPVQEKMFMLMPVIFTIMLASFPVGLVIYWTWNNILSMAQQWFIMRQTQKEIPHGHAKRSPKK